MGAIILNGVEHYFGSGGPTQVQALASTSIRIEDGEFIAFVGPSGCGKTTALNMVAGLIRPTVGQVTLDGRLPQLGDQSVGYLLARDALLPWRTALDNVILPLELQGMERPEREVRARKILQDVGLGNFLNSHPSQLSHGMRQRVAVARTLVTEPSTLLMDEPFSALDAITRLSIQQSFLELWQRIKSTVIFVTHDLTEAIMLADKVMLFSPRPGKITATFEVPLKRPRVLAELQGSPGLHATFRNIWGVFQDQVYEHH